MNRDLEIEGKVSFITNSTVTEYRHDTKHKAVKCKDDNSAF